VLEPIFLPPSAISIPRNQLAVENVLPSKGAKAQLEYMQARECEKRGSLAFRAMYVTHSY